MDTTPLHDFTTLFAQLGLDNSPQGIQQFTSSHRLAKELSIENAPFWNKAQRAFIAESLQQDDEWSEVIDQLSNTLR